MKKMKMFRIGCLALLILLVSTPAWSLPFVCTDPIDSIVDYAPGSEASPSDAEEKGYLAAYLGLTVAQVEALYIFDKDEESFDAPADYKDLASGFDPGFSWDYAIVKIDGPNDYWYMFMDDNATQDLLNGDDVLTTPLQGTTLITGALSFNGGNYGISHVSWFKPKTQIPEPTTLILLGFGLISLAGIRRK